MLAQFVEDFFHLERGDDGLDQHRRLDGALRQAQFVLGHHEDVVPEARFKMRLHLGQVEERAGAARDLLLRVMEHEQREVEDAAVHALAVDQDVLFVQMPAARPHLQCRDLVVQLVALAVLLERERAANRAAEVNLALDLVLPRRRIRILEIGHVAVSARIERVDHHLGFHRTGDLHAAAFQRLRQRCDFPVAFADVLRFRQEVRPLASIKAFGALGTGGEQLLAARLEGAVQFGDQRHRFRCQDGGEIRGNGRVDLNAGAVGGCAHVRRSTRRANTRQSSGLRTQRFGNRVGNCRTLGHGSRDGMLIGKKAIAAF